MSVRYLIDGYNLLYAMDEMPSGSWQDKREKLIAFLKARRPQGQNPITVVFDNREGPGSQLQNQDVTIVFTSGETADDWIGTQVRQVPNPRSLVVVSNDQGIRNLVRGTGARFMAVKDFLKEAPSSGKPSNPTGRSAPSNDSEITDELKRKWL